MIRTPTVEDASAVADFLNARSHDLYGETDLSLHSFRSWFQLPELEMLVAEAPDGVQAYADFYAGEGTDWAWIDPRPRVEEAAAVEPLVEAFERRAAELGRVAVRAIVPEQDSALRELLERRGYVPIRFSFTMLIELDAEPQPVSFAPGTDVRVMRTGEERAVHQAQLDAFADHWGFHPDSFESWRQWNLDRDGSRPDLWWLALDGDEIAGLCLNRMADSGEPDHGYVHILGVRPAWRRRGLGEGLLRQSFRDFWQHGCRRVSLDVDGENTTGAVRLYERAGMHVHRRRDTYEKRL